MNFSNLFKLILINAVQNTEEEGFKFTSQMIDDYVFRSSQQLNTQYSTHGIDGYIKIPF